MEQNYMKYGLIMCGVVVFCLSLLHATGQYADFEKKSPFEAIFILAPFVVWFLGIRARKKELKNKMTFKQGLTEGFKISLVFAVISPFIFMFYYLLFNGEILAYVRRAYGMAGASDTIVIMVDMAVQFIGSIVMGTIAGSIISFFLKSKS